MTTGPKPPISVNVKDAKRTPLPKRFYTSVSVEADGETFAVRLDGRPIRTPAKSPLVVPSRGLAEAIAGEWQAQVTQIDPATMPLTKLVNTVIDGVSNRKAEVAAEIVKYAGGDLLLYRADGPQSLVARQALAWDPVIKWAEGWIGGRFVLAQGIMPVSQPSSTLEKVAAKLVAKTAWELAALHVMTTLTGSALLALAHGNGAIDLNAAWAAAHVDEDHQIEQWGRDTEAERRRAIRGLEMQAASRLYALSSV